MINGEGAELVKEAECGMAVAAGDFEGLAESIMNLSKMDNKKLNIFGENGKTFYNQNFKKNQRIEQLVSLLN